MVTDNKTLDKVYTATNHEELMDAYKDWASNYDSDTVGRFGYVAHIASANGLHRVLKGRDTLILDAGCGTGLVGMALRDLGYSKMDGLDYSKEMLDEAKDKSVYRELMQADLSKPLKIADNTYDAVVCTGTFTYGHVNADAFEELIRVTKPGGFICFTIREGARTMAIARKWWNWRCRTGGSCSPCMMKTISKMKVPLVSSAPTK